MFVIKRARRRLNGLTILEIAIALVLLLLATLGTTAYRYHVALNVQKAEKQATAARVALLICESWKGEKGSEMYDAVANFDSMLTITDSAAGPSVPSGYTDLETYQVTSKGINFFVTLSWKQVSANLRELNVQVAWGHRTHGPTDFSNDDKIYSLTTQVVS